MQESDDGLTSLVMSGSMNGSLYAMDCVQVPLELKSVNALNFHFFLHFDCKC
jgi:hypothetical protein